MRRPRDHVAFCLLAVSAALSACGGGELSFLEVDGAGTSTAPVVDAGAGRDKAVDRTLLDDAGVVPLADADPPDGRSDRGRPPKALRPNSAPYRGYFTTPQELAAIKQKAAARIDPYGKAVDHVLNYVGLPDRWPWGTIGGTIDCPDTDGPPFIGYMGGGPLVLAKAYAFHLTGDSAYAADARLRILDLVDTRGWGGEVYSATNQCILNLGYYMPRFIQAAALLETYPGWTADDKLAFATWLATEVYRKTSWASGARANHAGAAGSYTSSMIVDYLVGTGITTVKDPTGTRTLADAWYFHRSQQFARVSGAQNMDSGCAINGIQDHGGIPEELRRGTAGCTGRAIAEIDQSYWYHLNHVALLTAHAELLLRRDDRGLYEHLAEGGRGSLRQAIYFFVANPVRSWVWPEEHLVTLEVAQRYYQDPITCAQLRCNDQAQRFYTGPGNRTMGFTTLTHGLAPFERPAPPPTIRPPGS